ncbi:MAG: caspase family protein, partial [Thermoguttaceae bacterium]|nr:caspase family protein [Thermoguttaceae bacterium]
MRDLGSCKRRAKRRAQAAIIAAALGFGAQNVASVAPSISNGLFENRAIFGAESAQTANRPMTAQAAKENRPTEFKAFFVGVHNYAEATDLPYAKKDVEDLAARFVEIGFKEKNVTVLKVDDKLGFDNWPTQKNIEARFGEFVNSLEKGDFAVLYLSGHGFQNDAGEAYFAPTDVTADNPFGTSVSIDWMLERLGESDADFCWAIVDACRNNLKEDGAKTPRQMFTGVRSFGPKDLAADFKNAPKTVSILRSCTPGQCSYEGGDGVENGLFTRALLEAFDPNNLKANGADGDLRFFEIISYVMKRTEELADACGVKQNPVEGGQAERSDFTLLTGLPTSE